MPYVNVRITKPGVTREQKRAIVAGITRLRSETLGKKPEHTHVVFDLVEEEDWGYAGQLTDEWKAAGGDARD